MINKSWREQRKAICQIDVDTYKVTEYISIYQAAIFISQEYKCNYMTARKEIKIAIKNDVVRYGSRWKYKCDSPG